MKWIATKPHQQRSSLPTTGQGSGRAGTNFSGLLGGDRSQIADYVDTGILDTLQNSGFFEEMRRKYGKP